MTSHLQACHDMLRFHGFEPRDILRDGIYSEGFELIKRDDSGKPVILDEGVATLFVAWPKSFPVASFFEHYWAWKGAVV